jgi:hypothetical protein
MNEQQQVQVPTVASFMRGLPWVIAILVFSFVSWLIWEPFFKLFMNPVWAQYAALGMGPQGALAVTLLALAGNWPLHNVQNKWVRGIGLTLLSIAIFVVFWLILGSVFKVDLKTWAFPIIATSWFFIAATSFVGGDAHMPDTPAVRRMFLNLLIMVGGTILVMRTIYWIPPFWFGLVEASLVSGGFAYLFRRVKQPTFSILCWSALILLTWFMICITAGLGLWTIVPWTKGGWSWSIGVLSGQFGVFFALTGGFNFSVNSINQCWPFSTIRQPWGYFFLLLGTFGWCILLAWGIINLVGTMVPADAVLWQSTILAWQTVVWGWAWVFFFGAGQTPYLWAGQKTPGTWDDVE